MNKSFLCGFLLIFLVSGPVFAQELPLVAVPGLAAVDVSEAEASTARSMLETGLVKTARFNVLSYNDVEAILEAQAFSLSGCVDDKCAIEVGQLLSAEIIVLGELSRIGSGYALNARMIDVTTSRTIAAEVISFASPEDMRDACFNAAYSLAGLRYIAGSANGVQEFGELYITAPGDQTMTVFLDGKEKGVTPLLLREVPFGVHLLQVKAAGYLFEEEISVNRKELTEIAADTARLKGNLLVQADPPVLKEYTLLIDGEPRQLGLINDITSGTRKISITSKGWSYYGEIVIKTGETVQTTLPLKESGSVKVNAPPESEIELIDPLGRTLTSLTPGLETVVPADTYTLKVRHRDYKESSETVRVTKMQLNTMTPALVHTDRYELEQEIALLEEDLAARMKKRKFYNQLGWFFGGVGTLSLGTAGTAEGMIFFKARDMEGWIEDYETATDPEITASLGNRIDKVAYDLVFLRNFRNYSLLAGLPSLAAGGVFFLLRPDVEELRASLAERRRLLAEENKK